MYLLKKKSNEWFLSNKNNYHVGKTYNRTAFGIPIGTFDQKNYQSTIRR